MTGISLEGGNIAAMEDDKEISFVEEKKVETRETHYLK